MASISKNEIDSTPQFTLELGQYYRLEGNTRPAHSYATQGTFDQEQWYLQQNIMSGFKVSAVEKLTKQDIYTLGYGRYVRQQHSVLNQIQLWVEQQRLALRHFIAQQPVRNKGLLLALLTGDQSLLQSETEQLFQRFGMSHLLAISGLHVLIFGFTAALEFASTDLSLLSANLFEMSQAIFVDLAFLPMCIVVLKAFVVLKFLHSERY